MKTRIAVAVLVVLVMLAPTMVLAQTQTVTGYKPYSMTISSGEDAISSGLMGVFQLKNEKGRLLEVAVQQEQAWVLWGTEVKTGRVSEFVAFSVGHMQGVPWAGPFATANVSVGKIGGQEVSIGTMQWPCFFLGDEPRAKRMKFDGKPENTQKVLLGYLASFNATVGPVGVSYGALTYLDDPWVYLPGLSFSQKIGEGFRVTGSVTRNSASRSYMYYIGITKTWSR
jgi:hypothetical protein